jgi:hypothetical protein
MLERQSEFCPRTSLQAAVDLPSFMKAATGTSGIIASITNLQKLRPFS